VTLEPWKSGEEIAATKLNQPVDAINKMPPPPPRPTTFDASGPVVRFGKVIAATADDIVDANTNPVGWFYELHQVYKGARGKAGWRVCDEGTGYRGVAYNLAEENNTGTGRQMNGVDHDGSDYPAGFEMQPLQVGAIVAFIMVMAPDLDAGGYKPEAWILPWPNGEDGECS
jgi:hypothetical protein